MMTTRMIRALLVVVAATSMLLLPQVSRAVVVTSIQTDRFNGTDDLDDVANIIRVTSNGIQHRDLIVPTDVDITGGGAVLIPNNLYEGQNNSGATPTGLSDVLLNADVTTGYTDPSFTTPVNVMFGQTIVDNGAQPDVFLFDITTGDTWTVTAITGGTATAPVLGGSASITANNIGLDADTIRASGTDIAAADLFGFGVDISGDLGEASVIGVRVTSSGADPSVVVASSGLGDSLTAATTMDVGDLTNLTSVTTALRGTIDAADLVGVTVFHLHAASNSNTVLSPGAADPGGALRTSLIDGDLALNTGLINPGGAGTLTAAEQASLGPANANINGLGVNFDRRLENGPGIDLVVFDIATNGFGDVDGFLVNRIDGVEGSLFVTPGDYTITGANLPTQLVTPDSSSLGAFIAGPWNAGNGVSQPWVGVGIDLSDLGYLEGDIVNGLLFSDGPGSGNVDFVLIAGLPTAPVPEPATLGLLGIGAIGLLGRRRRRQAA